MMQYNLKIRAASHPPKPIDRDIFFMILRDIDGWGVRGWGGLKIFLFL